MFGSSDAELDQFLARNDFAQTEFLKVSKLFVNIYTRLPYITFFRSEFYERDHLKVSE